MITKITTRVASKRPAGAWVKLDWSKVALRIWWMTLMACSMKRRTHWIPSPNSCRRKFESWSRSLEAVSPTGISSRTLIWSSGSKRLCLLRRLWKVTRARDSSTGRMTSRRKGMRLLCPIFIFQLRIRLCSWNGSSVESCSQVIHEPDRYQNRTFWGRMRTMNQLRIRKCTCPRRTTTEVWGYWVLNRNISKSRMSHSRHWNRQLATKITTKAFNRLKKRWKIDQRQRWDQPGLRRVT